MAEANYIHNAINRMAATLLSFGFCAFCGMAQNTLAERLSHVLETQDIESGLKLYNEITDGDLEQLPDSALFDYHYLGGYLNSEIPNHEKAIVHLKEAKRLCDSSLGTHSIGYMEIMRGLGDEYIEIGKYEEALSVFQEGIVKTTYIRKAASQAFGNLIIGVQECYEHMGWYNEIPGHLLDAWSFWDKDAETLDTYSYFPLWNLHQFYRRYEMYDDALQVSDAIIKFITEKGGDKHPLLAQEFYFRGNTLTDMGKNTEAIDAFHQGLSILKINKHTDDETYGHLLGNLLMVLVSEGKHEDVNQALDEIKKYSNRINQQDVYKNALYSAVKRYNESGNYTQALRLNKNLVNLNFSEQERAVIEKQTETIAFNDEITNSLPKLESQFKKLTVGSADWFETAHKLSSAYYLSKRQEDNMSVLYAMHNVCLSNSDVSKDYIFWVLTNLYGNCIDNNRFEDALSYAKERLDYLSSNPDTPRQYFFYALNDIIVAKIRTTKLNDIDGDLEKAETACSKIFGNESREYAMFLHNCGRAYQLLGKYDEAKQKYLQAAAIDTKVDGHPMSRTVQYLIETNNQIADAELDF